MNAVTLRREARLDALNATEMANESAAELALRVSNAADDLRDMRIEAEATVAAMEARWAANRAAFWARRDGGKCHG